MNHTNLIKNLEYLGPGDYIAIIRNSESDPQCVIIGPRSDFPLYKLTKSVFEKLFKEYLSEK